VEVIRVQVRLVVTNKALNVTSDCDLNLEDKVTIGRHMGSRIPLQGDRLSRHHFSLAIVNGKLVVEDLSSNGTWLNGAPLKLQAVTQVKSGDIIDIPGYEMLALIQQAEPSTSSLVKAAGDLTVSTKPKAGTATMAAIKDVFEAREAALLFVAMCSLAIVMFYLTN
jgi:predicted component of type VI protein secretion system